MKPRAVRSTRAVQLEWTFTADNGRAGRRKHLFPSPLMTLEKWIHRYLRRTGARTLGHRIEASDSHADLFIRNRTCYRVTLWVESN